MGTLCMTDTFYHTMTTSMQRRLRRPHMAARTGLVRATVTPSDRVNVGAMTDRADLEARINPGRATGGRARRALLVPCSTGNR